FRERTQGWIMALQLIRQVAQRHSQTCANPGAQSMALPDLSGILRQSEHDLFDYFAEEVFAYEPEPVRNLLARISLLERIEMETCGKLYPEEGCSVILPSLARRNVFTTIVGDSRGEEYRFHPLFQRFLRRRLRSEIGQAGVAAERVGIADYFLGGGNWEQAMRHFLLAEEFDRAAKVIADWGQAWITSGALASLSASADEIPVKAMERYPRALTYRAEVARLRGEYDVAQALLRRAAVL